MREISPRVITRLVWRQTRPRNALLDFDDPSGYEGRYNNIGDRGVWYASSTERGAWAELFRHWGQGEISPFEVRRRVGRAEVTELAVLDLTDPEVRDQLGVTNEELTHAAWYGWVRFEQGEVERAQEIFRLGLDVAEADNSYPGRAYLLSKLGVAADGLGNHEQAAEFHHEGREIFVKTGDLAGQGYTLSRLSWTYWLMGDYVKAKRYGEEGLEKFDEINHRWGSGGIVVPDRDG